MVKKIVFVFSFILISTFILIFGGGYVCGFDVFRKTNNYSFIVKDCKGLNGSVLVFLNGYKVGAVKYLDFDKKNFTSKITFGVDKDIVLTKNSFVSVETPLFGDKFLNLTIGEGEALSPGETVKVVDKQTNISELIEKAKDIADNLNVFLKKAGKEEIPQNINKTLIEISKVLKSINDSDIANNIKISLEKIQNLIQAANNLVDDVKINPRKYLKALL